MINAKTLRQRYEADLKELQDKCRHEKSEWMEYSHAPGHFAGEVKVCETCEKIVETRMYQTDVMAQSMNELTK